MRNTYRPRRSNESQEVGITRNCKAKVSFRAQLPFIRKVDAVLSDDREARSVTDIEACSTDNSIAFSFNAVFSDHAFLCDLVDSCKMDIDVFLLNCTGNC